jgi:hypothetical protein
MASMFGIIYICKADDMIHILFQIPLFWISLKCVAFLLSFPLYG